MKYWRAVKEESHWADFIGIDFDGNDDPQWRASIKWDGCMHYYSPASGDGIDLQTGNGVTVIYQHFCNGGKWELARFEELRQYGRERGWEGYE